jgi:hypothetical protein
MGFPVGRPFRAPTSSEQATHNHQNNTTTLAPLCCPSALVKGQQPGGSGFGLSEALRRDQHWSVSSWHPA